MRTVILLVSIYFSATYAVDILLNVIKGNYSKTATIEGTGRSCICVYGKGVANDNLVLRAYSIIGIEIMAGKVLNLFSKIACLFEAINLTGKSGMKNWKCISPENFEHHIVIYPESSSEWMKIYRPEVLND